MSRRTVEGDRAAIVAWLAARAEWTPSAAIVGFLRELGYNTRAKGVHDLIRLVHAGRIERRPGAEGHEYRAPVAS